MLDLHQYCLNNPFAYFDPDGRFAILVPIVNFAFGAGVAITAPIWGTGALIVGAGAAIGYAGYKGVQYLNENQDAKWKSEYDQILLEKRSGKKGRVDPSLPTPEELEDKSKHEDISHPDDKATGHHTYKDKKTGEIIRYDEGDPDKNGHRAHGHYHRYNPKTTGKQDTYLDEEGNPVAEYSDPSHLYRPEDVWWKK